MRRHGRPANAARRSLLRRWRGRPRRPRRPWSTALTVAIALLFAFPFYWVVTTSLSTSGQAYTFPPRLVPGGDFGNYARAWHEATWVTFFANTVLIATATTCLVLATSLLASFSLGITRYRSREVWFALILMILMVPGVVLIVPDYIVLDDLHWLNTYWAQIVPWGASVFGIFLLRQFFAGLPQELIDAAELDGSGQLRFLWNVAAPMAWPALVTIGIYTFIASWDSFLWPFIVTNSPSVQPIEVGLATFYGVNGTDWPGLSAAVVFTTAPVMVLFLLFQRRLVEGAYAGTAGITG